MKLAENRSERSHAHGRRHSGRIRSLRAGGSGRLRAASPILEVAGDLPARVLRGGDGAGCRPLPRTMGGRHACLLWSAYPGKPAGRGNGARDHPRCRSRAPDSVTARLLHRTTLARGWGNVAGVGTLIESSVTWAQSLSWRMERQWLDPVGSESVAGVVRRLGAVLSMDESLAELAVRTRRSASRPGELRAALVRGGGQGVRLPRVDALPVAGGRRDLPGPAVCRPAVGVGEPGGALPARAIRLARLEGYRREALRGGPLTAVELGEALATTRRTGISSRSSTRAPER